VGAFEFVVRNMLRLSILSSVIPLALVGGVTHDWTHATAGQCFAAPAARSVAFTADPLAATVKVQIVASAELADLAIVDEAEASEPANCGLDQAARMVTVTTHPQPGEPIVHLSRDDNADYRIYVDSRTISPKQAAALIVAERGGQKRLAGQPADTTTTASIQR
jgi:hypothetical protein